MRILSLTLLLTLIIETITVVFRFGLGLQATHDTLVFSAITFGYRIHHGYIGAAIVLLALAWPLRMIVRDWAIVIGLALLLSDVAHHFLVLWPVTGNPEFYIRYP